MSWREPVHRRSESQYRSPTRNFDRSGLYHDIDQQEAYDRLTDPRRHDMPRPPYPVDDISRKDYTGHDVYREVVKQPDGYRDSEWRPDQDGRGMRESLGRGSSEYRSLSNARARGYSVAAHDDFRGRATGAYEPSTSYDDGRRDTGFRAAGDTRRRAGSYDGRRSTYQSGEYTEWQPDRRSGRSKAPRERRLISIEILTKPRSSEKREDLKSAAKMVRELELESRAQAIHWSEQERKWRATRKAVDKELQKGGSKSSAERTAGKGRYW